MATLRHTNFMDVYASNMKRYSQPSGGAGLYGLPGAAASIAGGLEAMATVSSELGAERRATMAKLTAPQQAATETLRNREERLQEARTNQIFRQAEVDQLGDLAKIQAQNTATDLQAIQVGQGLAMQQRSAQAQARLGPKVFDLAKATGIDAALHMYDISMDPDYAYAPKEVKDAIAVFRNGEQPAHYNPRTRRFETTWTLATDLRNSDDPEVRRSAGASLLKAGADPRLVNRLLSPALQVAAGEEGRMMNSDLSMMVTNDQMSALQLTRNNLMLQLRGFGVEFDEAGVPKTPPAALSPQDRVEVDERMRALTHVSTQIQSAYEGNPWLVEDQSLTIGKKAGERYSQEVAPRLVLDNQQAVVASARGIGLLARDPKAMTEDPALAARFSLQSGRLVGRYAALYSDAARGYQVDSPTSYKVADDLEATKKKMVEVYAGSIRDAFQASGITDYQNDVRYQEAVTRLVRVVNNSVIDTDDNTLRAAEDVVEEEVFLGGLQRNLLPLNLIEQAVGVPVSKVEDFFGRRPLVDTRIRGEAARRTVEDTRSWKAMDERLATTGVTPEDRRAFATITIGTTAQEPIKKPAGLGYVDETIGVAAPPPTTRRLHGPKAPTAGHIIRTRPEPFVFFGGGLPSLSRGFSKEVSSALASAFRESIEYGASIPPEASDSDVLRAVAGFSGRKNFKVTDVLNLSGLSEPTKARLASSLNKEYASRYGGHVILSGTPDSRGIVEYQLLDSAEAARRIDPSTGVPGYLRIVKEVLPNAGMAYLDGGVALSDAPQFRQAVRAPGGRVKLGEAYLLGKDAVRASYADALSKAAEYARQGELSDAQLDAVYRGYHQKVAPFLGDIERSGVDFARFFLSPQDAATWNDVIYPAVVAREGGETAPLAQWIKSGLSRYEASNLLQKAPASFAGRPLYSVGPTGVTFLPFTPAPKSPSPQATGALGAGAGGTGVNSE